MLRLRSWTTRLNARRRRPPWAETNSVSYDLMVASSNTLSSGRRMGTPFIVLKRVPHADVQRSPAGSSARMPPQDTQRRAARAVGESRSGVDVNSLLDSPPEAGLPHEEVSEHQDVHSAGDEGAKCVER